MDETEHLLSSEENAKRLKASIKELEESSKDDFFGIWADKEQDVAVYVRNMRKISSPSEELIEKGGVVLLLFYNMLSSIFGRKKRGNND